MSKHKQTSYITIAVLMFSDTSINAKQDNDYYYFGLVNTWKGN